MSNETFKWYNSEDYNHDTFQAFFDHEFNHNQTNSKNANRQSFETAWNHQAEKINDVERRILKMQYAEDDALFKVKEKIANLEEMHRMQMAAVSVISLCNTEKSLSENTVSRDNNIWCAGIEDVEIAAKREILLIAKVAKLKELILLTDPCVSNVVVSDLNVTQWQSFLDLFPDERAKLVSND